MVVWIILFIWLIVLLKLKSNLQYIVKRFERGNCLVFGKKRKGKDLLFQAVIKARKQPYFANIPYGYDYNHINLEDVNVADNTHNDLIHNRVKKSKKIAQREKRDIYVSEASQYLPSQFQHLLVKRYPGMPMYYGMSGHLYDSNVHMNYNGAFTRLWDKPREQADEYFRALRTIKMPFALYVRVRHFEEEQAAKQNVMPFNKKGILGDRNAVKAARQQFESTYGSVKDMWVRVPKRIIQYDTRHFEKVFFTDIERKEKRTFKDMLTSLPSLLSFKR